MTNLLERRGPIFQPIREPILGAPEQDGDQEGDAPGSPVLPEIDVQRTGS